MKPFDTPNSTLNTRMYLHRSVRFVVSDGAAVADSESRNKNLMLALCLSTIALLLIPVTANAATAQESKELFKLYTHTQLLSAKQYYCIEKLWDRESHWDPTANNPKSTAYGIPQLLHLKETNPFKQIDRGLSYIKARYGTPCKAYAHHLKVGHY